MRIISIEDCRRVFLTSLMTIFNDDSPGNHTYTQVRNRERINLDENSGDIILVPTRLFNNAVSQVVKKFGLHEEQARVFKNVFADLGWILRPKDRNHQYKRTLSEPRSFWGKNVSCYQVDGTKFDLLMEMNGRLVKTIAGGQDRVVEVAVRTADDAVAKFNVNGVAQTRSTTVTSGAVQDAPYLAVFNNLRRQIIDKVGEDVFK